MVRSSCASLLFLFETKLLRSKVESLRVLLGFSHCLAVNRVGFRDGVALFRKNNVDVFVFSFSIGHIDVFVKGLGCDES